MLELILWHTPLEAVVAADVVVVALGVVVGTTVVVVDAAFVSLTLMEANSMSKSVTFKAVLFKTFLISVLFGTDEFTN